MTPKFLTVLWIVCMCLVGAGCVSIEPDSVLYRCTSLESDPCGSGYFCGDDSICHPLGFDNFDTLSDVIDTNDTTETCTCDADAICFENQCLSIVQLALGAKHSCARFKDGQIACWGDNRKYQTNPSALTTDAVTRPQLISFGAGVALNVCAGTSHTCALVKHENVKSVRCWGDNSLNQLGLAGSANTISDNVYTVAQLDGDIDERFLACGASHTCAVLTVSGDTNQVRCWGDVSQGQLGNNATDGSIPSSPDNLETLIPSSDAIEHIAAGQDHTCLLHNQGQTMTCWGGRNEFGQLGKPPNAGINLPESTDIETLNAKALSAGESNTCLVDNVGAARCLGGNTQGQLGAGLGPTLTREAPTSAVEKSTSAGSAMSKVLDIDSGENFSCAVVENTSSQRQAFCWGKNDSQQIAKSNSTPLFNRAVLIDEITDVGQIATGGSHACIVQLAKTSVFCWGANDSGQLGDGTTNSSEVPKPIF
jgi:alpha-tubulin suppressor-like RCC1 family protein